jgi:hypothetical protein
MTSAERAERLFIRRGSVCGENACPREMVPMPDGTREPAMKISQRFDDGDSDDIQRR